MSHRNTPDKVNELDQTQSQEFISYAQHRRKKESLLGRLAAVLNINKTPQDNQPNDSEHTESIPDSDFEAYPYTAKQLGQLYFGSYRKFPTLPQIDPSKHRELPHAEIDRINKDIKERLIFSILIIDSMSDKLDINPSKHMIALGGSSVKSHEFRSVEATASSAPDSQTLLSVWLKTGYSVNGSLVRGFIFKSPNDFNPQYFKQADLLDLLRDKQTRITEASRTLTRPSDPHEQKETVSFKGNFASVHEYTSAGAKKSITDLQHADETFKRVLSLSSL